ncbi:MAG: glycosyltransferase family 4 protein [Bosea sp.]|uniref:MraY family glycosyltransferase n=1 Tax=unclassified Bosea (in: a-proteobacteria) TaxID=2653178 RepID=UPI00095E7FB5|nr:MULTISPECIES: glycosyltransferase family 4 protein [unclassified Bosea (in: a-proteobacteria)]MBN9457731.1 glycosyltransferase family 4 protein [Bosea sp. (in: a-proteobacteria)]OJV10677.1 MAG: glycosyl transferase [Bosea sp. 67-29]
MALASLAVFAAAASAAALLCVLLRPLLQRYALARPNARSSHSVPTPQGGGIAVLAGAFLALGLAFRLVPLEGEAWRGVLVVATGAVALAVVGAWDDIRPLPASLRLALQAACVGFVLFRAAPELRLFPEFLPLAAERVLALLAGVWFVNLVNFMDGLDWITVAGIVPLAAALALAGNAGVVDPATGWLAAGLCGGLIGFAPFNRPVAKLFLGDVGSLPIGLLTAYLLFRLAGAGAFAAALILPLYHVADATITLLRRLARGERVWEAHRSHFYQQATTNGFGVRAVVGRVAALNVALAALAGLSIAWPALWAQALCLGLAILLTASLLRAFATPRGGHG